MSERVIVLGAGGFIGRRVVAALQASGWASPVLATRRPAPPDNALEHAQIDATDERALSTLLQDATGVVNCVAGDAATILANASALFKAAARSALRPRVVYLSSMAVYGQSTGVLVEAHPLNAAVDPYGTAKIAAERIAATYERAIILRPGIVFGPESFWWSGQIGRLLLQRRLGDLGSAGRGTCNLLFVEDMARAAVQALKAPNIDGSCFNLAMASPPSWNEYFTSYARALRVQSIRISPLRLIAELRITGPLLKITETLAHAARVKQPLPPPIRPWLLQLARQHVVLNVAAAERSLHMQWTALEPALAVTAAWMRASASAAQPRIHSR